MKITIDTDEKTILIHKECNVLELLNSLHKLIGDRLEEFKLITEDKENAPVIHIKEMPQNGIMDLTTGPHTMPNTTITPYWIYYGGNTTTTYTAGESVKITDSGSMSVYNGSDWVQVTDGTLTSKQ